MNAGAKLSCYNTLLLVITGYFEMCASVQFDRVNTGIIFSPYVKLPWFDGGPDPPYNNYTNEEVRVMLEVIMGKFSKVMTWDAGSNNGMINNIMFSVSEKVKKVKSDNGLPWVVSYIQNVTYYKNSDIGVYVAEIAAALNRDLGQKNITIIQGIYAYKEPQMETEVKLAIECAEKANEIFPGTVEGIVFYETVGVYQAKEANKTLKYLKFVKDSTPVHLKLGTNMYCEHLLPNNDYDNFYDEGLEILMEIVKLSDFVACIINPEDEVKMTDGPLMSFEYTTELILDFQAEIYKINSKLDVMIVTKWASEGTNVWENIINMRSYWEFSAQWASLNNVTIWFTEAFNNPWRYVYSDRNMGWWKLTDNLKSNRKEGYIEKILDQPEIADNDTTTVSSWDLLGIVLGLSTLFLFVLIITVLCLHVKRLEQQLSRQDIREFKDGMSNEIAAQQDNHNIDTCPFKLPYDKSHEIRKHHLIIQWENVLGTGQFGCVVKALVKKPLEEEKLVALKMARDGCSRSALKGLLSEIKIMIFIGKHPNIVEFSGAYTKELHRGVVYIATELCALGSLQDYLREQAKTLRIAKTSSNMDELFDLEAEPSSPVYLNNVDLINLKQMLKWSHEIACGMEYLGTKNVVHADLATRNVLLTTDRTAKISDFGLSRRMYNYLNYVKTQQEPLPWRWMAIESLNRSEFSAKSDVWSYGVTLWEIFTLGATPFSGLNWTTDFVTMLENGLRMTRPTYGPPEVYELMVNCWEPVPEERPGFARIQLMIENFMIKIDKSGGLL